MEHSARLKLCYKPVTLDGWTVGLIKNEGRLRYMAKDGTKRSTSYQGIGGKRGYSDSSLTRAANEPVIGMSLLIVLCGLLIVTVSAGRDPQQRLNFRRALRLALQP